MVQLLQFKKNSYSQINCFSMCKINARTLDNPFTIPVTVIYSLYTNNSDNYCVVLSGEHHVVLVNKRNMNKSNFYGELTNKTSYPNQQKCLKLS